MEVVVVTPLMVDTASRVTVAVSVLVWPTMLVAVLLAPVRTEAGTWGFLAWLVV